MAALTKRSIPNEKLAAYIAKVCKNFTEIFDEDVSILVDFAKNSNL